MKNKVWRVLFLLFPLIISWAPVNKRVNTIVSDDTGKKYKTEHHIIIVLDGPRWSETWGDTTYRLIPNQANILKKEGTFFNNFKNNGKTLTNAGHTAITTGVYQRISNVGKKLPKNPSIFQYYLKQKNQDKRSAWILTSKGKLEMLANTENKKWWNSYMPSTYCGVNGSGRGYPDDKNTIGTFKSFILENNPKLAIVNLLNIDAWAHQGNWDKYVQSIKDLDEMVLDLWNAIQNDPELKDKTAIYITNDHGRHLDGVKNGYESHGDNCEGCRHISLLAIGPDFEKNKEVNATYSLIDIPATISYMMDIDMPTSKGKPIGELINTYKK